MYWSTDFSKNKRISYLKLKTNKIKKENFVSFGKHLSQYTKNLNCIC